jgi:hypothetical protein
MTIVLILLILVVAGGMGYTAYEHYDMNKNGALNSIVEERLAKRMVMLGAAAAVLAVILLRVSV